MFSAPNSRIVPQQHRKLDDLVAKPGSSPGGGAAAPLKNGDLLPRSTSVPILGGQNGTPTRSYPGFVKPTSRQGVRRRSPGTTGGNRGAGEEDLKLIGGLAMGRKPWVPRITPSRAGRRQKGRLKNKTYGIEGEFDITRIPVLLGRKEFDDAPTSQRAPPSRGSARGGGADSSSSRPGTSNTLGARSEDGEGEGPGETGGGSERGGRSVASHAYAFPRFARPLRPLVVAGPTRAAGLSASQPVLVHSLKHLLPPSGKDLHHSAMETPMDQQPPSGGEEEGAMSRATLGDLHAASRSPSGGNAGWWLRNARKRHGRGLALGPTHQKRHLFKYTSNDERSTPTAVGFASPVPDLSQMEAF